MRTPIIAAALATFLLPQTPAHSEEIFKIQIGKDYSGYSEREMKKRIWELERAVYQLQARVFQLEAQPASAAVDEWVCTISAMGDTYTGTGASQALAKAKSIENCKAARGDGFFCKNPKCEN